MQKKYDITDYDDNLCLRVTPLMWVAILFLSRAYLVVLLSVVNFKDPLALINMFYSKPVQLALGALAGIPVIIVLYALRERKPGASLRAQWIWRQGRNLLLISAALNILVIFIPSLVGVSHHLVYSEQAQAALSGAVLVLLLTSKRVSDTFSDFPKPVGSRAGS